MLKKILLIFVISGFAFAQKTAAFKVGYFDPTAADGGFIIGYEGWRPVDRNFALGWSIDWFNKNYVDKKLVSEFDDFFGLPNSELNELRAKTNLHSVPLMFSVTGNFPVAPKTKIYFTAAAGVELLLIFYNDFENPTKDDFHAAYDFNWRLGSGIWYEIGARSDLLAELTYHFAQPGRTFDVEDRSSTRKRTFERTFEMSGIMIRVGSRFYF